MGIPKVATVHDLSGLGRCSLTAVIPILAAMGVQACPLPTAVLSNQTGFPGYTMETLTPFMRGAVEAWEAQQIRFDGVYTGFLADVEQVRLAGEFIGHLRGRGRSGLVLVDPVLGDGGSLYPVFGETMVEAVLDLVKRADVITPNLTEACLLAGEPCVGHAEPEQVWALARRLTEMGPGIAVISGVSRGETLCNYAWLAKEQRQILVCNRRIGGGRSGTGDILASVLCGGLVGGKPPEAALHCATALLEAAVADAFAEDLDPNEGVPFESHLRLIMS